MHSLFLIFLDLAAMQLLILSIGLPQPHPVLADPTGWPQNRPCRPARPGGGTCL